MEKRQPFRGLIPTILALFFLGLAVWLYLDSDVAQQRVAPNPRKQMAALTNADRQAHGLKPLQLNLHVSRHATRHTRDMADAGRIFHSTPKQLRRYLRGFKWTTIGENVGVGGSLKSLEEAFMSSKDHRANILSKKFTHIAVGVVRDADAVWVTVIFYG